MIEVPQNGVYVVAIDPDITGIENIGWAFLDESEADRFVDEINECEGRDTAAWVTFEPIASNYDDPDFQSYRRARLGQEENSR